MKNRDIEMARRIAAEVDRAGGRTFYVGGYVRDLLLGRENKDIDIEVHGVPVATLEGILDGLGERMTMGASFGIMGLRHCDIDIAMPRSEVATGCGHKDFEVFVDPFIGEKKAAQRRDFTMNALMQDVLTGEVLDFFGGRDDMAAGRIRHVNDATFVEDPLRVFRAAQFAARFGFRIAPETSQLARRMDVTALSCERVMGELEKALMKARKPSLFFEALRDMGQLTTWFPEVEALIGIPQSPAHHPEGDVWTHTLEVLDEAAAFQAQAENPLGLMLAALCHDFGKAVTTETVNGAIHAYGHEKEGLPLIQRFLERLTHETALTKRVMSLCALHMKPNRKIEDGAKRKSFMKLFDEAAYPEDLLLLSKADFLGRYDSPEARQRLAEEYAPIDQKLRSLLDAYRALMARPYLMGRDLIQAGVKPGPLMGEALEFAHKLRLAGLSKELQLSQTLGYLRSRHPEG